MPFLQFLQVVYRFYCRSKTHLYSYLENEEHFSCYDIEAIKKNIGCEESLWEVQLSDYEGYNFANLFEEAWGDLTLTTRLNDFFEGIKNEN